MEMILEKKNSFYKYDKYYFASIDMRKIQGDDLKKVNLCSDNCNFVINHQPWFGY